MRPILLVMLTSVVRTPCRLIGKQVDSNQMHGRVVHPALLSALRACLSCAMPTAFPSFFLVLPGWQVSASRFFFSLRVELLPYLAYFAHLLFHPSHVTIYPARLRQSAPFSIPAINQLPVVAYTGPIPTVPVLGHRF